ncbi:transglycosylase domain-containing protein [Oxalobacteraceae bacterium R-40]|uniref:Transglycosylase domain-containing protein n=1 Tax=Keguizhuia sedimenti TaxID=3064264 RepID=A0ABU1BJ76_9BURK|nr:transglycosylase domain-containing protein [Oxalobacteraceae bacterium R-40]
MDQGHAQQTENMPDFSRRPNRLIRTLRNHPVILYGLIGFVSLSLLCFIAAAAYIYRLVPQTPEVTQIGQAKVAQPSVVLTADGTQLVTFRRNFQEWVELDKISPHVIQALISTEDKRFYDHAGVDVGRTLAALFFTAQGDTQGGSTITQQLARNIFTEEIGRSRNINRKLKEIITALKIERQYSKEEILEIYLNTVPFLYNAFGIEMAARTYFRQSASQLGPLESATLVGMLKGTHYYNPVVNPERARARRNIVLFQMQKEGQLSQDQYLALRDQPLQIRFSRQVDQSGPSTHFAEHARKWLIDWADRHDYDLYTDGLIVHTTLDEKLQEAALRAVEKQGQALQHIADVEWGRKTDSVLSHSSETYIKLRSKVEPFSYFWNSRNDLVDAFIRETPEYRKEFAAAGNESAAIQKLKQDRKFMQRLREQKTRLETGFVAIDPVTGEVKAWVGSRDFEKDQFDHVAQAERQPGSTFKPIVYGAALEQGFHPARTYRDNLITIQAPDGDLWRPTDMTAPTGRAMSMREGLIHSKNTITAQVMQDAGLSNIVALAQAVGVNQSKLTPVPSLALGTSPVTLLEMVTAYATIAQAGEFKQPVVVKRITDRNGNLVAEFNSRPQRALSESTALELIDMMRGVVNRGTGQVVKSLVGFSADIAGKTGTTQNNTDGWFIMMHPNLVAGSWVGFNDSRVTMRSDYWGQGGHNALLVVGDFFRKVLKEKQIDVRAKFPKPPKRMPLMVERSRDDWATVLQERAQGKGETTEIIVRQEPDGTTFIGDSRGAQIDDWPETRRRRSPEELARIMRSLGRDPVTGAALETSRSAEVYSARERQTSSGSSNSLRSDGSPDVPESFR